MESLSSERLLYEPLAPAHFERLYAIYQDPAVSEHLITRPRDRAAFEAIFQNALSAGRSLGMWALFATEGAALVGRVGFFEFSDAARPELAFLLGRAYWGNGYATEACRAVLAWAFAHHSWRECIALVRPGNRAAIRVCSNVGMMRERAVRVTGSSVDLLRVTREEFEARCASRRGSS